MAHRAEEGVVFRPMAQGALSESTRAENEILRGILQDDQQTWLCPHCETEVELTKDRVIDHIIEHPAAILRETCYWRCPLCNAVAGQESWDYVEPIEYISSKTYAASAGPAALCGCAKACQGCMMDECGSVVAALTGPLTVDVQAARQEQQPIRLTLLCRRGMA